MSLTFQIKDTASDALMGIPGIVKRQEALFSGGRALRSGIIDHLNKLGPNSRYPGMTTHFWGAAAKSTTAPRLEGRGVVVSITKIGARYNYFGGTIKAPWKNGSSSKYLTIPACEEAYGHRAREFNDLKVAFLGKSPSGAPILALVKDKPGAANLTRPSSRPLMPGSAKSTASRRQSEASIQPKKRLNVMYWLVTEVTKQPNKNVLPTIDKMSSDFGRGVREYVAGALRGPSSRP